MNKILNEQKGITLIALTITIIIILILVGIGIGVLTGVKGNIKGSKDQIAKSDLAKVQQAVMEIYIKYQQTGNERVLKGIPMEYTEVANIAQNSFGVSLRVTEAYTLPTTSSEEIPAKPEYYFKLEKWHLSEMGFENLSNEEYIVNYSTGEVFNYSKPTTATGDILYIYAK